MIVPVGLVEELELERCAVASLEADLEAAWLRRDYGRVGEVRRELAGARDRVVALELVAEPRCPRCGMREHGPDRFCSAEARS